MFMHEISNRISAVNGKHPCVYIDVDNSWHDFNLFQCQLITVVCNLSVSVVSLREQTLAAVALEI